MEANFLYKSQEIKFSYYELRLEFRQTIWNSRAKKQVGVVGGKER